MEEQNTRADHARPDLNRGFRVSNQPQDLPDLPLMLQRLRGISDRVESQGDQLAGMVTRIYGEGQGLKGQSAAAKVVSLQSELFEVIDRITDQLTRIEEKTDRLTHFV